MKRAALVLLLALASLACWKTHPATRAPEPQPVIENATPRGERCDQPVLIQATTADEYDRQQRLWMDQHYPKYSLISERDERCGNATVHVRQIRTSTNSEVAIYFARQ